MKEYMGIEKKSGRKNSTAFHSSTNRQQRKKELKVITVSKKRLNILKKAEKVEKSKQLRKRIVSRIDSYVMIYRYRQKMRKKTRSHRCSYVFAPFGSTPNQVNERIKLRANRFSAHNTHRETSTLKWHLLHDVEMVVALKQVHCFWSEGEIVQFTTQ